MTAKMKQAQESASNDASHTKTAKRNLDWMLVFIVAFFIFTVVGEGVLSLSVGQSPQELVTYEQLGVAVKWKVCRDIELDACQELIRAGKVRLVKNIPEEAWNYLKQQFERTVIAA
jgi:hypothetical protein